MKLVKIEWLDSRQPTSEWQYLTDYKSLGACKCVSVGFLVHDDDEVKGLAESLVEEDDEESIQVSGVSHIPTCSITKITELEEKRSLKKRIKKK